MAATSILSTDAEMNAMAGENVDITGWTDGNKTDWGVQAEAYLNALADYDFVTDTGILSQVLTDNTIPMQPVEIRAVERVFIKSLKAHVSKDGPFVEVPGAKESCRALRESKNYSVAMATGSWRSSAPPKLEPGGS